MNNKNPVSNLDLPSGLSIDYIFKAIQRRKKILLPISSLCVLLGFFANALPPVWEGEFQIVIEDNDNSNQKLLDTSSFGFNFNNQSANKLNTEVKILESPSILQPIFEYVKEEKNNMHKRDTNIKFRSWKKKLKVKLEDNTSVLNINYRDKDKDLIIPVLTRISKAYQTYSGRDRLIGLEKAITYLERQEKDLSLKSTKSMKKFQEFSLKHKLGSQDGLPIIQDNIGSGRELAYDENDSGFKVNNKILDENNSLGTLPQRYDENFRKLSVLESQLVEKSAVLNDNSDIIISLRRQIDSLKASITRPQGVLLKYRELNRIALRDERTLTQIEDQLNLAKLEKARKTNPWELISDATVIEDPVYPRKYKNIALGLLSGLFLGCISALIIDKRSNKIFNFYDLDDNLDFTFLVNLKISNIEMWKVYIDLIAKGELIEDKESIISLIPVGDIDNSYIENIKDLFKESLHKSKIKVSTDFIETKNSIQILLLQEGFVSFDDIDDLNNKIILQGSDVLGWMLVSD